jgi:hypothetical protein
LIIIQVRLALADVDGEIFFNFLFTGQPDALSDLFIRQQVTGTSFFDGARVDVRILTLHLPHFPCPPQSLGKSKSAVRRAASTVVFLGTLNHWSKGRTLSHAVPSFFKALARFFANAARFFLFLPFLRFFLLMLQRFSHRYVGVLVVLLIHCLSIVECGITVPASHMMDRLTAAINECLSRNGRQWSRPRPQAAISEMDPDCSKNGFD